MCGLIQSLLKQCIDVDEYTLISFEHFKKNRGRNPTYDIVAKEKRAEDGKIVTTGLTFITTGNAKSASFALRRLSGDSDRPDHVLIVTEKRMPLKLGSKGKKYLEDLEQKGKNAFQQYELSFEEYARLDALQAIIGSARSGDLEIAGEQNNRISESEVIESHHRCDRYRQHPLLCEFLTEDMPKDEEKVEWLANKPAREFIMAQLSLNMGMTTSELANKYCCQSKNDKASIESVKTVFVAVAKELHESQKISAKPVDDDLFLLLRA